MPVFNNSTLVSDGFNVGFVQPVLRRICAEFDTPLVGFDLSLMGAKNETVFQSVLVLFPVAVGCELPMESGQWATILGYHIHFHNLSHFRND